MPSIRDRGEGNMRRRERIAKLKKGPGSFVYDGTCVDVESIPSPMTTGKNEPVLDATGMPVTDKSGRAVYQPSGQMVRNADGSPKMGGIPKLVRHKIETLVLRGVSFPKGKPVLVEDEVLAVKVRGMDCFKEVLEEEAPAKKGPGRPKKEDKASEQDSEG